MLLALVKAEELSEEQHKSDPEEKTENDKPEH
jgi:hypothetical protein